MEKAGLFIRMERKSGECGKMETWSLIKMKESSHSTKSLHSENQQKFQI